MNYFTEIATWILKCTIIAYHCLPPLRFPASLGILRWGNASDQKLEVGELRSPRPIYTPLSILVPSKAPIRFLISISNFTIAIPIVILDVSPTVFEILTF